MEFLVSISVNLPHDLPEPERAELQRLELERARVLLAQGVIGGLWRIPGERRNVGVWQAADATHLHELISSLPLFPWVQARVTPLATHPAVAPETVSPHVGREAGKVIDPDSFSD